MTRTIPPFHYEPKPAAVLCEHCRKENRGPACEYYDDRGICRLEYERRDREHRQKYSGRIPDPDQPKHNGVWF